MSQTFQVMVQTPAGLCDPSLAIAACRAGSIGVLDLEYCTLAPQAGDLDSARAAIARLVEHAGAPFGIKIDAGNRALARALLAATPELLTVVVLAGASSAAYAALVALAKTRNLTVLAEVTSAAEAQAAVAAGADGIIAKGHEAGGRVGEESTFVLLQRLLAAHTLPIYAHGGVGLHSAAACYVAGAAGVVLDSQLALTRESPLPEAVKEKIALMDGSETTALGMRLGAAVRVYARPGLAALDALRREENRLEGGKVTARTTTTWRGAVAQRIGWGSPDSSVYPLGQDACFAAGLAARYVTVAGVVDALRTALQEHCRAAQDLAPLDEQSPLAQAHGTRYPIAQGPMTRVSDTAAFAASVAEGGALPFLALALMRAPEVRALLDETKALLGERPWGVGILGFVSPELREEQIEVVRAVRPPWALIAGGRPQQAYSLEQDGIPAYLHVPSPGLLRMFLQDGAHRFVFEGRECGGHVGPRTSFVLWDTMVDVLLETRRGPQDPPIDVLFAGGIHDARSAAMVAALAAPLAEKGMRIGVLMGTAYLFTEEAVASGTIVPAFQEEALTCAQTVLLESGPGHATRCVDTAFAAQFEAERRRLIAAGTGAEELRGALEDLNLGRLRVASKGITRHPRYGQDPDAPKFISLGEDEQRAEGMYMIGQVAGLRDAVTTVAALHHEVSVAGTELLHSVPAEGDEIVAAAPSAPVDVAIVGISALLPGAVDAQTYWENILNKVNAIGEVPPDRWDWRRYYDEDKSAPDRVYSRWGGFLDDVPFDPLSYGMPPNSLRSVEPLQLLTLEAVRAALADAGYDRRPFPRERTAVILGASGVSDLGLLYGMRSTIPSYLDGEGEQLLPPLAGVLPEWTEDSFPGVLMNVTSGRVTNRFDFGGTNFTVDAACASSLAAVSQGIKDLQLGQADVVVAGGADTAQNAYAFMAFSKTQALSPRGQCRPFDETADGIAISEGAAVVILKRLADAERDGDRIYAVIKGVGSSSDGRDKSLTAPRPAGQIRALERAYRQAGFSPATVGLIEAHGTGTKVGDKSEVESLSTHFEAAGAAPGSCAIGSVKSLIGHTKATAGVASLVKVALALYHKTLPPTLVETPNSKARFGENPFYVNSETRPWLDGIAGHPRRAGVSAFGFGGTNFHVAVEEYTGAYLPAQPAAQTWPSELLLFRAPTREGLRDLLTAVAAGIDRGARPALRDLAYSLAGSGVAALTVAIVATSLDDLRPKLQTALDTLSTSATALRDPRGIYFDEQQLAREGKVAFLFPGQGSQYVDMLRDLAVLFPEVHAAMEQANASLRERFPESLSSYVYPQPAFDKEAQEAQQAALTATDVAQPALGATGLAMMALLATLNVKPDAVAGHSYGEFVALHAAGVYDVETLFLLSEARGRFMVEAANGGDAGTMAAVSADAATVAAAIDGIEGIVLANLNAPTQTVISGTTVGIATAVERVKERGLRARQLPVACAFHSPLVAAARDRLVEVMGTQRFAPPLIPVYANTTGQTYPADVASTVALLGDHLVNPVRFVDQINAMHEAGVRLFVEVGARNVLTGLVGAILGERPHLAVATDQPGRHGLLQLQHALGQLAAAGLALDPERLFRGRGAQRLDVRTMDERTGAPSLPASTWLVNGGYVRPLGEPKRAMVPVAQTLPYSGPTTGQIPQAQPGLAEHSAVMAAAPASVAAGTEVQVTQTGDTDIGGQRLEPLQPPATNGHSANGHAPGLHGGQLAGPAGAAPAYSSPPPAMPLYADDLSATVMQFQQVMSQFLETQRAVMAAYFGQPAPAAAQAPALPALPPAAPPPYAAPAYMAPATYAPSAYAVPAAPPAPIVATPAAYTVPDAPVTPTPQPQAVPPATEPAQVAPVAVAPAPAAPVAAAATAAPALTEEELTRRLLAIVAERTGYPTEMLDLDLDLEADLGIDSIKRVEIVGSLRRAIDVTSVPDGAMEKLSAVKTLRAVVGGMMAAIAPASGHPPPANPVATVTRPDASPASVASVPRFVLRATAAPSAAAAHGTVTTEGIVVVSDDERGIAHGLADELRRHGHRVAVLRAATKVEHLGPDLYTTDFADPDAVSEALDAIRRGGEPIGGIVHLLPLREQPPSPIDWGSATWKQRLAEEVKGLYHLARAAGADLTKPGTVPDEGKRGLVVAATGLGGAFGLDGRSEIAAGHGGISGFLKSLALEWPHVQVKAVDVDPAAASNTVAQQVLEEIVTADGEVEIGRQGEARFMVEPVRAPLDGADALLAPDPSWVVLVTGGARGITTGVARELAQLCRPTLVLVGRSALPHEEPEDTAGLQGPRELKAALIARMKAAGEPVQPARVEAAYTRLLQDREMRAALASLRETGATVHYYPVDVRDEASFCSLIDGIYQTYGRLDGVIHGAGVIEDKLVLDKTPESFDRVFGTKTESAYTLARALRPESLRFLAFFSSVTAAFGNKGQADYGATNGVMNKLAQYLDRRWPGRVVAFNWGPWGPTSASGGMVSAEIEAQFARRGVELLDPAIGYRRAVEEVLYGAKGDVEVVYGDGPWGRGERRMSTD